MKRPALALMALCALAAACPTPKPDTSSLDSTDTGTTNPDVDADGIPDAIEGTDDTDSDGTPDFQDPDSDGDGIGDAWEAGPEAASPLDSDGDNTPDYLDSDSDDDGIPDGVEGGVTDPASEPRDTDGDGVYDFRDTDSDADALPDQDEAALYATDPTEVDTDGDGQADGAEVLGGSDPTDPTDVLPFYLDLDTYGSGSLEISVDPSVDKVDIAFIIDTTCSMYSTGDALSSELVDIAEDVSSHVADPAFAFASFEDINCCGFGTGFNTPFRLDQQVTTDLSLVQGAVDEILNISGEDGTGSAMEALYQAATGEGFDLACDGTYTDYDDVRPFAPSAVDVFGGTVEGSGDPTTPGTGTLGGLGLREGVVPVFVYATDSPMRDGDKGYPTTGTACHEATGTDVAVAITALGGYLVGVGANTWDPTLQMEDLARRSGSMVDQDGDGVEDPLVTTFWGSNLASALLPVLDSLLDSLTFTYVSVTTATDALGLSVSVDPERAEGPFAGGEPVTFTVRVESEADPAYEWTYAIVHVEALGDDTVSLGSWDVVVAVEPVPR